MNSIESNFVGKYVIVRTDVSGVTSGFLEEYCVKHRTAVLRDARRLWKWEGAFTLFGAAKHGLTDDSKISESISYAIMVAVNEITLCTPLSEEKIKNIDSHDPYKQRI